MSWTPNKVSSTASDSEDSRDVLAAGEVPATALGGPSPSGLIAVPVAVSFVSWSDDNN